MPLIRIVPASDGNCTYGGTVHFRSIVRSILFFFNNYNIQHFHVKKILTHSSSYTEHVSAPIIYLGHVFDTLKRVLSEMIEIVPPYTTELKTDVD